jgi:hypothetical protein
MPRKPPLPGTMNRLERKQVRALEDYTEANYVSSGATDILFAGQAQTALGFKVTCGNVQAARDVFGIVSNRDRARQEKRQTDTIPERLAELERKVSRIFTELELK